MESVQELLFELVELFTSDDSPIKAAIAPLGEGAVLKVRAPGGSVAVEKTAGRFVYSEETETPPLFELHFMDPRDLEAFREVKDARHFGFLFMSLVREGKLKLDMLRPFIDLWSLGVGYFLEEIGILAPPQEYEELIGGLQLRDIAFSEILDVKYLQELVDELARITGVRLWVLDMNSMPVVVSATGGEHCKLIIDSLEGVMRCYDSAIGALAELRKTLRPRVRVCHAGFMCFDAPLILGGEIVGMISGDASLMEPPDPERYRRLAEELGVDPEPLLSALRQARNVNIEEVEFLLSVVNAIAQVVTEMSFKQYLLSRQMEENAQLTRELRRTNLELKALFQSILEIQERERSAVARDLHDDTGQNLSNALLNLELALGEEGVPDAVRAHIESASSSISQVLKQVHDLSASLHPPVLDDLGLSEALRNLVRRMNADHPIEFSLLTEGEEGRLSGDVKINLYRIAQEALNNVVKHSGARRARVELRCDEKGLEMVISDDGRGFAEAVREEEALRAKDNTLSALPAASSAKDHKGRQSREKPSSASHGKARDGLHAHGQSAARGKEVAPQGAEGRGRLARENVVSWSEDAKTERGKPAKMTGARKTPRRTTSTVKRAGKTSTERSPTVMDASSGSDIHLGMVNMRERAERIGATLEFPPCERGVTVVVRLPS